MSREPRENKNNRETRAMENRVHEERNADLRPTAGFLYNIMLNVPEAAKKDGYSYCYMVYREDDDSSRMALDRAENERGFTPARKSEHPLLARYGRSSLFKSSHEDDFIRRGEQVLMERPTAVKIEEEEQLTAYTKRQMEPINNLQGRSTFVQAAHINFGRGQGN